MQEAWRKYPRGERADGGIRYEPYNQIEDVCDQAWTFTEATPLDSYLL